MQITRMLLDYNKYSRPNIKIGKITKIVIHWVGNAASSAAANRNYFNNLNGKYASSHYIVGLNGEIIQCIPENEIAYHGNNENNNSIGIEVCHPDWTGKFSEVTYNSLVELCADICKRYKLDHANDIIRHYDCRGANHKCCPKYFVEHEDAFVAFKRSVANELQGNNVKLNTDDLKALYDACIITDTIKWQDLEYANKNLHHLIRKMALYVKSHK